MRSLLIISLLSVRLASAGSEVGNGGQDVALEFTTFGFNAAGIIQRYFHSGSDACRDPLFGDLCNVDVDRLRASIQLAKVLALPELSQTDPETGRSVAFAALNFPGEQRILVSEAEWLKPQLCYVKKVPLVLHEYLGLMGVEIENYRYSSLLSAWLVRTASAEQFQGCPQLKPQGELQ